MKTFEARYPGRCVACPDPIDVGDILVFEEGAVVHVECRDGHRDPNQKRGDICPRCFTEKSVSGDCSC